MTNTKKTGGLVEDEGMVMGLRERGCRERDNDDSGNKHNPFYIIRVFYSLNINTSLLHNYLEDKIQLQTMKTEMVQKCFFLHS